MIYAGLGSRQTPASVLALMSRFAKAAAALNWTLRTGGAQGADTAFMVGCSQCPGGLAEVFLPWRHYNNVRSRDGWIIRPHPSSLALTLAREHCAHWPALDTNKQRLHAVGVHAVEGWYLNEPADVVVCWTPDGQDVGRTGCAIQLARSAGIEVVNLGSMNLQQGTECLRELLCRS